MSEEICTDGPVFYRFLYICFILDWIGLHCIRFIDQYAVTTVTV